MDYEVVELRPIDWSQAEQIYFEGIATGTATFQSDIPSWEEWDKSHAESCRLAAKSGNEILGWAALSPTSSRFVYRGVAEVSIYVGEKYRGKGIGESLLKKMITVSEENGFWSLESGIIRENSASIGLHRKCGFREIGYREKPAKMGDGEWYDVVLMERRSKSVGTA